LHFAACWWPSTQASLRTRSRPQTPGILLSLPLLSLFDPHFQGKRQLEKKNGFEWDKTPYPPNPRHYGAVTVGGEGGKEHFGRATFGGAAVGRLGMSVLRDATYATLGARASLCTSRDTSSHFELAYDGVARRARPQTRTCICLFSSRRACAVSAFSAFGHLGPHMRLCARNGPFPRGFSSLAIFFYFFCRRQQPLEVPRSVRPHTL
jgi:hypothetical protein